MLRGEIYLVNLDPARSGEANKVRPAVIVSNDGANRSAEQGGQGVITVVPITSNISRVYHFQVFLPAVATGLRHDAKAQAEQVRSVMVERFGKYVGTIAHSILEEVDEALRLHLAL